MLLGRQTVEYFEELPRVHLRTVLFLKGSAHRDVRGGQPSPQRTQPLVSTFRLPHFVFRLFCGLHDTCAAYHPARVGNVLGSERIYDGRLPLPSLIDGLFCCGLRPLRTRNLLRASPIP